MNKSREPQRFPVEPETVMAAYEILIKNCRNHHHTCQGCPLHITDPEPYQSGIPRYTRLHKGVLSGGISLRRLHGRSVCLEV